jgi:hypothetical protein
MVKAFEAIHGREPAGIRLTADDAAALEDEIRSERGKRQDAIDSKGFKVAYAKLGYVTPITSYDATTTALVP